jgi:hypothetical protein
MGSLQHRTTGADPGFQGRGAHLKKLRRAEGGAKIFEVFRVKCHDFTPKNPGSAPEQHKVLPWVASKLNGHFPCILWWRDEIQHAFRANDVH